MAAVALAVNKSFTAGVKKNVLTDDGFPQSLGCGSDSGIHAGMDLSFCDEKLRRLCNTRALLRARFGESGLIVERRLLTLADAKVLRDVTTRAPDRRRLEPGLGGLVASVCARDAGRIYFKACGLVGKEVEFEEVDHIEIFAIERREG